MRATSVKEVYDDVLGKEEGLSFFASSVTGIPDITVHFKKDVEVPCSDVQKRRIFMPYEMKIPVEDFDDLIVTSVLHECGHVWFTGDLKPLLEPWGKQKWQVGSRKSFVLLVNAIEDVRIENLLSLAYPQAKHMFNTEMVKVVKKTLRRSKTDVLKLESPLMAIRFALENKIAIPFVVTREVDLILYEAERLAEEYDLWNGDFTATLDIAKQLHPMINSWRDEAAMKEEDELGEINKELLGSDAPGLKKAMEELLGAMKERKKETLFEREMKEAADVIEFELREPGVAPETTAKKLQELKDTGFKTEVEVEENDKPLEKLFDELKETFGEHESFEDMERDEYRPGVKLSVPVVKEWVRGDAAIEKRKTGEVPEPDKARLQGQDVGEALKRQLKIAETERHRKRSGKLDMFEVKRAVRKGRGKLHTDKIFKRVQKENDARHNVLVLVDLSGSMEEGKKMAWAKQALVTMAHAFQQLPTVNYSLRGYSATDGMNRINDVVFKEFGHHEGVDVEFFNKVHFPHPGTSYEGQNRDGDSVRYCVDLLRRLRGKRLLIVISDGEPHHAGTTYTGMVGREDTKLAIQQALLQKVNVVGIAIDTAAVHFVQEAYEKSVLCVEDELALLPERIIDVYIDAMYG